MEAGPRALLRRYSLLLAGLLLGSACKRESPGPEVDRGLEQALDLVASRCSVEVETAVVQCSGVEMRELARLLVDDKQPRLDKLHTLAVSLSHSDARRRVVAANLARNVFGTSFGPEVRPGAVHAETAEALISGLRALPPAPAKRVAPVAAHAAMLAGRGEPLYAALQEQPNEVKLEAYRALMTYGRLAAFSQIEPLAAGDQDQVTAALASVAAMQKWTAAEQAEICPWLAALTRHDNRRVVDQAFGVLSSCKAEEYQKLRTERSRRSR